MARSTELNDLVAKRICDALKAGHSFDGAARAAGLEVRTVHYWRRKGRDGIAPYVQFLHQVESARAVAENRCIEVLRSALESTDLRLAVDTAWRWLARRRPEEWGETKGEAKPDDAPAEETTGEDLDVARSVVAALESRRTG